MPQTSAKFPNQNFTLPEARALHVQISHGVGILKTRSEKEIKPTFHGGFLKCSWRGWGGREKGCFQDPCHRAGSPTSSQGCLIFPGDPAPSYRAGSLESVTALVPVFSTNLSHYTPLNYLGLTLGSSSLFLKKNSYFYSKWRGVMNILTWNKGASRGKRCKTRQERIYSCCPRRKRL